MPIFKVYTVETKEVEMTYMVEAGDEDEAADMIDQLRGMDDEAAAQYLQRHAIEPNLEAYEDAAQQLRLDGVEQY
ncbi:hypothetical protein LCGC14_0575830 [marine sediment metagenome]|uniref:Uncharacterized protein n=1 Tax=marine sediment metagenome TaxID=412755 RepID=A0A0F9RHW6_9ZZZZ